MSSDHAARPSTSGSPQRDGTEAPYTSEAFEVDPDVGTDSPLDTRPADAPDADGSTSHIRNPDGTPIDNPSG
ncbi:MAG TPA: hypothetical protein VFL59_09085 [Candidatus Nanopelagicales bacterium]|nr:hypothetical protein [Candidatus Nanopelagicales bacterium]